MAAPVLVDTVYLVALIDPRDALHAVALALARKLAKRRVRLVTSDAVLIELGNYFARSPLRSTAADWIQAIRSAEGWDVVALDRPVVSSAESRYRTHADKNWSMTDCIIMEVMDARGMRDIATTDHGFEQAGYRLLLP